LRGRRGSNRRHRHPRACRWRACWRVRRRALHHEDGTRAVGSRPERRQGCVPHLAGSTMAIFTLVGGLIAGALGLGGATLFGMSVGSLIGGALAFGTQLGLAYLN